MQCAALLGPLEVAMVESCRRWAGRNSVSSPVQFGNLGRNAFRGPAVFNTDFSLFKSFPIREGMNLQLRFEAFNVFNIQNYDTPAQAQLIINSNATQIAANAGRITSLAQGTTPRQMQFGLRFVF